MSTESSPVNARSISEMKHIVSSNAKPNYGCIRMPLLEIDLDHIIPDELHMLLRVTDVLIQNLVHAATSHDKNISNVSQSKVKIYILYWSCMHVKWWMYICTCS